jgi:RHS repeat-associated protein
VLSSTDPDGVTPSFTYMPTAQVATVSYSGSSAHSVGYAYDANGQNTGMTHATGTSSTSYDPFGEMTSATNGAGQTVGYGYNADGDTTGITYPLPAAATWAASDTLTYGYDNAGALNSVTDFNGHQLSISRTADSLPSTETLGSTGDTLTTNYDSSDSVSAIALMNGGTTAQSFSYSDAPDGDALTETDTPSSSQSPASYTYDSQGRVISMTPGTGTAHSYGFDASSDLTTLPTGAAATYDHDSELTSSALGGTTTSYTYNADGQRLTTSQGGSTVTSGTWNGAGRLTEQVNLASGAITYLVSDSLGSVRGTVSASGAVTGTTSYHASGNPQTSGGLTTSTPFGYAGSYTDPTGLLYLVNRYCEPATGQFTSVDPAVSNTGQPYQYASGNPVSGSDPSGMWRERSNYSKWNPSSSSVNLCINLSFTGTGAGGGVTACTAYRRIQYNNGKYNTAMQMNLRAEDKRFGNWYQSNPSGDTVGVVLTKSGSGSEH